MILTNTYTEIKGDLIITKNVLVGGDETANKTYTFTVTGPNGFTKAVIITGAGSATLEDMAPGPYSVTEQDANIDGYTLDVTGDTTPQSRKTVPRCASHCNQYLYAHYQLSDHHQACGQWRRICGSQDVHIPRHRPE